MDFRFNDDQRASVPDIRVLIFLLASIVCAPTPALARQEPDLPPGVTAAMIESGSTLFTGKGLCISCHGTAGEGAIGPDLTDSDWVQAKGSYLSIMQVILSGVPLSRSTRGVEMPPRGGGVVNNEDIQDVAAYVWSLSHPGESLPPGIEHSQIEKGKAVFNGPGRCVDCHGSDAAGIVGPNLNDSSWIHAKGGYLEIVRTVLLGVPVERSTNGIPMPPKGGSNLTNDEVQEVAAFVWALSNGVVNTSKK